MSLMSGLVESPVDHTVAVKRSSFGEWTIRYAWRLMIGFSLMVWLAVAAIVSLI
jgi:hypothetical protein